jgi:DNA-binding response OmpR family regulator
MHTLILASNLQQAAFIKKGMICENLSATVLPFDTKGVLLLSSMTEADGVLILADNPASAIITVDNCRLLRPMIPIIILSPKNDTVFQSLVEGRKIIHYFIRPFPFRQIAAEMKYAIFRQREKIEVGKYILRDLELDVLSHRVKVKSTTVYLRNKEFSLLHYLMANRGRVLTRSDILHHVWDRNTDILTNTVDVHVSLLRKKIEKLVGGNYIRTVPCLGYVLE